MDMVGVAYCDHAASRGRRLAHSRSRRSRNNEIGPDCQAERHDARRHARLRSLSSNGLQGADEPALWPGHQAHHPHQRRRSLGPQPAAAWPKSRPPRLPARPSASPRTARRRFRRWPPWPSRRGAAAYHIKDPAELPAIYIKETRLVSQSFVHDKTFHAQARSFAAGPDRRPGRPAALYGFVRTTRQAIAAGGDADRDAQDRRNEVPDPGVLAIWPGQGGGLHQRRPTLLRRSRTTGTRTGPAPTCTSSSGSRLSTGRCGTTRNRQDLQLTTEYRDGKVRVVIDATQRRRQDAADQRQAARPASLSPTFKGADSRKAGHRVRAKERGVYEAEFKAEEAVPISSTSRRRWNARTARKSSRRSTASGRRDDPVFA